MLIPIYKSRQTSYQNKPGCKLVSWGITSVESFEPIDGGELIRGELRRVTEACDEPVAVVRAPAGTKLVTLEVPGSPVNPLVFAEIPDPKRPGKYLSREQPGGLLACGKSRIHGCELVAEGEVPATEIDRTVVVVPPVVESKPVESPQVCDANPGSPTDVAGEHSVLAQRIDEALTAEQRMTEQRITERLERARQAAWEEHQAMARPTAPLPGRKKVAVGQGSLF